MEKTAKITKAMVLNAIRLVAENGAADFGDEVSTEDVIAYCDTTLEQMANKQAKAKARAAVKKVESDELRDFVATLLTETAQTRDEIFAQIEDESGELTVNKVGAKLTALVNAGVAVKEPVKIEGIKGSRMGYKLA